MNRFRRVAPVIAVTALLGLAAACARSRAINTNTVEYLTCAAQPGTASDQKTIGRAGGFLAAGGNSFLIPGKALNTPANFAMSRLAGTRVGVEVTGTPAPPALGRDATVFISFAHCTPVEVGDTARWTIARFPNLNAPTGQKLTTGRDGNVIWGYTDQNSVFVIVAD